MVTRKTATDHIDVVQDIVGRREKEYLKSAGTVEPPIEGACRWAKLSEMNGGPEGCWRGGVTEGWVRDGYRERGGSQP